MSVGRGSPSRSTPGNSLPYTTGFYFEFSEPGAERRITTSCPTQKLSSGCEIIETTVRTRRLQWVEALIHMDGGRLPNRVMFGGMEGQGQREAGERKRNRRTVWQKMFGLLVLAGT